MKRKLLAAVLSMSMILGTGMSALAADVDTAEDGIYSSGEISGTTDVTLPIVKVTVPSSLGDVVLNPYKMEVTVGDDTVQEQILTAEQQIQNFSNVGVAVNVSSLVATKEEGSDVIFATAALKGNETTKSVFMYMEMIGEEEGADYKGSYDAKATNQILVSTKETKKDNVILLDKSSDSSTEAAGNTATVGKFKFVGTATTKPAKAWAATDSFTIKMKFTFIPQVTEVPES